jgi:hypothetical protein
MMRRDYYHKWLHTAVLFRGKEFMEKGEKKCRVDFGVCFSHLPFGKIQLYFDGKLQSTPHDVFLKNHRWCCT